MKLNIIAQNMFHQLDSGATQRSAIRLQHGLALSLTTDGAGAYTLNCGRLGNVGPSTKELEIVAGAFKLLSPVWQRTEVDGWTVYRYSWRFVFVE